MWGSRKQKAVVLSTTEAEFTAACGTCVEIIWCEKLLNELQETKIKVPMLLIDNQAAICWIKNGLYEARAKHVDIKYKYICEKYHEKVLDVKYVRSVEQEADIFTKALPRTAFENLIRKIAVSTDK